MLKISRGRGKSNTRVKTGTPVSSSYNLLSDRITLWEVGKKKKSGKVINDAAVSYSRARSFDVVFSVSVDEFNERE